MPDWRPHPRQERALERSETEILYGGARGGGKTDAGLVWLTDYIDNPNYKALVIRKNADDLSDWVGRAVKFYKSLGASIAYRPAIITFPSGAEIRTGHLKDDQAYTKYQGHEYQQMVIEELTQVPDEKRYIQLIASCRSTVDGIRAQIFCTTNPGGMGHAWVKRRFVDPAPPNVPFIDPDSGRSRIYIPATVDDNPTLMEKDPGYVKFLEGIKSVDEELWKAWRMGSWDVFAGMFFKEFTRAKHVINPFIPNKSNVIIGGMDWGYNAPFCFSLSEVSRQTWNGVKFYRVRTFMEVYGTGKTAREWAHEIKERLKFFDLTLADLAWIQGDPAMFNKGTDGSVSIKDQFVREDQGYYKIQAGSNDRIPGWAVMRNWLSLAPDGVPYWQITNTCVNGIKEIGSAVYDEKKFEDLDAEFDHFLDQERYKLKKLKWIDALGAAYHTQPSRKLPLAPTFIDNKQLSINLEGFTEDTGGELGGVRH